MPRSLLTSWPEGIDSLDALIQNAYETQRNADRRGPSQFDLETCRAALSSLRDATKVV